MSSRPFESPPPYRPDEYKPSIYAPSQDMYGGKMPSQPAYSYYPEDEVVQHFYKWSSPPGVIKIMAILIVIMCVGIFACVASTLPWDLDITGQSMGYGIGGGGGYSAMSGYNSYGFGGSSMGLGFAYGGNYTDPRAGKGFILAMAAFCFICGLVIFVMSVTRSGTSTTRRFYLIVIIVSGILGGLIFIATIVYIMAVNPVAQASGSAFYNQILSLCSQFYAPAVNTVFVNQYLYHYCVVEPQEAIAIVLGFLIVVAFAIIIFFAVKTRRKINNYGKSNILWKKMHEEQGDPNVEEWVKNVSSNPEQVPAMSEYNEKVNGSIMEHRSVNGLQAYSEHSFRSHPMPEVVYPVKNESGFSPNVYSSSSEASKKVPRKKRPGRPRRSPNDYDTDYTTGGESAEELDDDEERWESEYPPITSDQQRQDYKREFDADLQEYKRLQAELEEVSTSIDQLDRELDEHPEGSQSYKGIADEYNRLKDIKSSSDYKNKRKHCKQLKMKLNHIKSMVSIYDRSR